MSKGCRLGGNKGNCGFFTYVFTLVYDGFHPIFWKKSPFEWCFISFQAECNSQRPINFWHCRATGGSHQSIKTVGGLGWHLRRMRHVFWKKNSWVAWAGIDGIESTRMHRGTKNIQPRSFRVTENASIWILAFVFFGFFSVCTSTRMGLNRPEVQEGAWLSQHQQRRWRHIQDIWVFCMMAGWFRRRKGSAIVLWMILLQEAAKEEQDTDDLEEEDEEAQRRASCVETRAVCARVASKRV